MKRNKILQSVLYMIQGAIVGVGAILPGVSGGVLCVAFGIYEPMMELLTNPKDTIKKSYKMFIPFISAGWLDLYFWRGRSKYCLQPRLQLR